jgi:ankyrin repeat protein
MSEQTPRAGAPSSLPDAPSLDWLRKQAKRRLDALRESNPSAKLTDAQFELAKEYGFSSWRALKAHIDSLTTAGQLVDAARTGDVATLGKLLDEHPEEIHLRQKPYEWTLLHTAAQHGQLDAVNLLLDRGLDPNTREKGDNTYPMHWAAAAGHLDVVRRLADAGGDVVGRGDDHALEVIGWATCWRNYQSDIADFLVSRGARHHIFSAIALNLADDVRRIVAADRATLSARLTRNDGHRTPLHHAVFNDRPDMVALLLDLGADPLAVDGGGHTAVAYATTPTVDRPILERIRAMTEAELVSARRGNRKAQVGLMDVIALLGLGELGVLERIVRDSPELLAPNGAANGALHVMAKRNDVASVTWLLDHGADPNARWSHWGALVTPLHLAAMQGHAEMVRLLLARGADPRIHDSEHDGDAMDWARFFERPHIVRMLEQHPLE